MVFSFSLISAENACKQVTKSKDDLDMLATCLEHDSPYACKILLAILIRLHLLVKDISYYDDRILTNLVSILKEDDWKNIHNHAYYLASLLYKCKQFTKTAAPGNELIELLTIKVLDEEPNMVSHAVFQSLEKLSCFKKLNIDPTVVKTYQKAKRPKLQWDNCPNLENVNEILTEEDKEQLENELSIEPANDENDPDAQNEPVPEPTPTPTPEPSPPAEDDDDIPIDDYDNVPNATQSLPPQTDFQPDHNQIPPGQGYAPYANQPQNTAPGFIPPQDMQFSYPPGHSQIPQHDPHLGQTANYPPGASQIQPQNPQYFSPPEPSQIVNQDPQFDTSPQQPQPSSQPQQFDPQLNQTNFTPSTPPNNLSIHTPSQIPDQPKFEKIESPKKSTPPKRSKSKSPPPDRTGRRGSSRPSSPNIKDKTLPPSTSQDQQEDVSTLKSEIRRLGRRNAQLEQSLYEAEKKVETRRTGYDADSLSTSQKLREGKVFERELDLLKKRMKQEEEEKEEVFTLLNRACLTLFDVASKDVTEEQVKKFEKKNGKTKTTRASRSRSASATRFGRSHRSTSARRSESSDRGRGRSPHPNGKRLVEFEQVQLPLSSEDQEFSSFAKRMLRPNRPHKWNQTESPRQFVYLTSGMVKDMTSKERNLMRQIVGDNYKEVVQKLEEEEAEYKTSSGEDHKSSMLSLIPLVLSTVASAKVVKSRLLQLTSELYDEKAEKEEVLSKSLPGGLEKSAGAREIDLMGQMTTLNDQLEERERETRRLKEQRDRMEERYKLLLTEAHHDTDRKEEECEKFRLKQDNQEAEINRLKETIQQQNKEIEKLKKHLTSKRDQEKKLKDEKDKLALSVKKEQQVNRHLKRQMKDTLALSRSRRSAAAESSPYSSDLSSEDSTFMSGDSLFSESESPVETRHRRSHHKHSSHKRKQSRGSKSTKNTPSTRHKHSPEPKHSPLDPPSSLSSDSENGQYGKRGSTRRD
ncbi:hypothetical protein BLNAU_171 [Blattamonas nauphoetae]|uniref:Uncharacterized protein n=1 Tax=Blattamonas nauphoetae TaxID=2049346 RepID=A0ABQ9YMA0_9EUKA|nr:hypothetical protein BLNAU_171 [Blattamonas nauphoetae]